MSSQNRLNTIQVYTDGACEGNQFKKNYGGWGAIILIEKSQIPPIKLSGAEQNTTNNRMEMTAVIRGLEYLSAKNPKIPSNIGIIEVYSDSNYVVNCFKQKWYVRWEKNGWKNAKGKPVENPDLWRALLGLTRKSRVAFIKVKAHSGNKWNEQVDQLAVRAIQTIK